MALRDFNSCSDVVETIRPQVASGAVTGETVDMQGADSVLFAVTAGAITGGNGDSTVTLEESSDGDNWSDVSDDDIIGTEPSLSPDTAYQFGYIGGERYLRANFDLGTETDAAVATVAVRSHLHQEPEGYSVDSEA